MVDEKRSFVVLDGLRGIAAIAVVTRHVKYFDHPLFESYLAVDFFFVLSGFVLSHAYAQRLRCGLSTPRFLTIRLIRLYPLYGLTLLVVLAVWGYGAFVSDRHEYELTAPVLFFSALLLPTPAIGGPARFLPLNLTAWSLFFELTANAWWASVWRRITNRGLAMFVVLMALILTGTVLSRTAGFQFSSGTGAMDSGYEWPSIAAGFIRVGYSFFCGVLLHRIWRTTDHRISPPWIPCAVLLTVLCAHPPAAFQPIFDIVSTLFAFPLIVWIGANSRVSSAITPACSALGVASYGVYIFQGTWLDIFSHFTRRFEGTIPSAVLGVAFIVSLFTATLLLDKYFDRPTRRWLTLKLVGRDDAGPHGVKSSLSSAGHRGPYLANAAAAEELARCETAADEMQSASQANLAAEKEFLGVPHTRDSN